jgi:uncharacterized protein
LVLFFLVVLAGCPRARDARPALEPLAIVTSAGVVNFEVEVAQRPGTQERGLMYRQSLAADQGMLFLFEGEQRLIFWMKNTYLPLDIIFIRANGQIVAVVADTEPLSEAVISPNVRANAALEVNAGTAKRLHIAVGDEVRYAAFGNSR